jgi:hypothetical protein
MKRLKYIALFTIALTALAIGCKDEELNPYIPPEGNAHGFGQFVSQLDNTTLLPQFGNNQFYDQTAVDRVVFYDDAVTTANQLVKFKLQWQSIDNKVNISNIELYLEFDEVYSDNARNPKTARHGGPNPAPNPTKPAGMFWKSIPAGEARVSQDINITAADIYEVFKNNTFDYGAGAVNIFSAHPYNSFTSSAATGSYNFDRSNTATRFKRSRTYSLPSGIVVLAGDVFRINWRLIADDGAAYASWSAGVCSSVVGATCFGQWTVNRDVFNPRAAVTRETGAKAFLKGGDKTTLTIAYDKAIATPPTITIVGTGGPGPFGTVGAVTPVAGSTSRFTVEYTAPVGFTGAVTVRNSSAVSTGSAPSGGLTQIVSNTALNIDNTAPQIVSAAFSPTRVGRGQSTTLTLTFNEAMSAVAANAIKFAFAGQQGLDDVAATNFTLAASGLTATYLYIWRDTSVPFDNAQGVVSASITGGKDLAGNDLAISGASFTNDVGSVVLDAISSTGSVAGVNVAPTATNPGVYDLGTQLKWNISQAAFSGSAVTGTWFWIARARVDGNADGDLNDPEDNSAAPVQATRTVTGLQHPVYNGFAAGTTSAASGSTTSSGENFTPFTPNGQFDIYMYFVSSTGNVSANVRVLTNIVMN